MVRRIDGRRLVTAASFIANCSRTSQSGFNDRCSGGGRRFFVETATTAQAIFFRIFLIQSAAFFFHVAVMSVDDAAAYSGDSSSSASSHVNDTQHLVNAFYRHYYGNNFLQQQQPHNLFERASSGNLFLRSRATNFLRTTFDDVSVYRDFTVCSNDVLSLSCPTPDATVFLLSLFPLGNDDALRDASACIAPTIPPTSMPHSTNPPVDLSCQYFKNNVQTIRSRCKSTSSCTVRVADLFDYSNVVQRPCTVIASYQCHPSPKMKNLPQYLRFCTNDVMRLACPDKQDWLVITTAVYDFRPPGGDKTCSNVKRNVYCYAPQTQSVIRGHCERKRTCKLFINETTFGPIFGRTSHQQLSGSSNNMRPVPIITTAPAILSGHDADATAQCPSADNFALYVYFMCVPRVILSSHPRTSLAGSGSSSSSSEAINDKQSTQINGRGTMASASIEDTNYELAPVDRVSVTLSPNRGQVLAVGPPPKPSSNIKPATPPPRRPSVSTARPSSLLTSSTSSNAVSSSVIEQPPSPVFRLFSDWLFAVDYIQRNPYPVVATVLLGLCLGLLLGAAVLLIRLSCRLRAARYHPARRSVGLQCEMYVGRPAVLVRSTASQTMSAASSRPISGAQEPPPLPPPQQQLQQQQYHPPPQQLQQQRMIAAATTTLTTTSNGHYGNHHYQQQQQQQQQQNMQAMAAMCAQSTVAPPPSGLLNPSLYAAAPAATAMAASRPLLVPQQQPPLPPSQQQMLINSNTGSSSVASQVGAGNLQNATPGPNRTYTYTPRLSVRWFQ